MFIYLRKYSKQTNNFDKYTINTDKILGGKQFESKFSLMEDTKYILNNIKD